MMARKLHYNSFDVRLIKLDFLRDVTSEIFIYFAGFFYYLKNNSSQICTAVIEVEQKLYDLSILKGKVDFIH